LDYFDEVSGLNDVLRTIYSAEAKEFPQVLDSLTRAAARCVPGADHAGITASSRENEVTSPSVSGDCAKLLDEIQQRHLEGPCLQAAWTRKAVEVEDLTTDPRWPKYRADALEETRIRSVLSLPLFADELSMGALNFYAERAGSFSESSRRVAATLATAGALAWSNAVRGQQFAAALNSRDTIGQAKGILMERYEIDDQAAFNVLVKLSQSTSVSVRDIARRLIDDAGM
jgi:GAF domain-containing protein